MGFYDDRVLPAVIDFSCSMKPIMELRNHVVPMAQGKVLEVGMGSGINLSLYNPDNVEFVWGLEPSEGMRRKAQKNLQASPIEVKWLGLPGEQIPLEDNEADTVLLTYTLCTIPDWKSALQQMHRVLKPGGKLLFCEHGRSPDAKVQKWQDKITPLWKKMCGGCHLNRPISDYISESGFTIEEQENQYLKGSPKFVGYMYWGVATANK